MNETAGHTVPGVNPFARLAHARRYGKLCAVFFALAALCVLDGLQMLMRHDFNRIDLIPGETAAVSGSMPQGAETYADLTFTLEGSPDVRFTPLQSFKGFWFGGLMWRGEISAAPQTAPGRAVLTIIDRVPAKKVDSAGKTDAAETATATVQNPMQVHQIHIYPNAEARQADDPSFLSRLLKIQPFAAAGGAFLLAMLTGVAHWLAFGRAEKALAAADFFFIHGVKPTPKGSVAAFALVGRSDLLAGMPVRLSSTTGEILSGGTITEISRHKGFALFPPMGRPPRYGELIALE